MSATALPRFWELTAQANWDAIDFISDIHLCPQRPQTFAAWAAHMRHSSADAIFLLGDVFELWVGDDCLLSQSPGHSQDDLTPSGGLAHSDRIGGTLSTPSFEADCAAVLAEASAQRTVGLMVGNRDFLMGSALLRGSGLMALSDPAVLIAFGERALLTHGDALCLADTDYQRFRSLVRSAPWQRDFLSKPVAQRRAIAQQIRMTSMASRTAMPDAGVADEIDIAAAVQWMHEAGAPTLIHGHIHRPRTETLAPGFVRHVLSEWELDAPDAHPDLQTPVLRWQHGRFSRLAPTREPVAS